MKLLDEKLVEEAAKNAVQCRFNLKGVIQFGDIYEQGFIAGVSFAEQQLKEKMIAFADFVYNYDDNSFITTEQLLEQFLNK